jgi:hypothetical protein
MSLEQEIQSQLNESEEQEQQVEEKPEKQVLPVSGVFNSIFLFLSKDWSDEDRQKLILDEMESENLNEMLTPMILRIAEKLGLAVEEISALISLAGLLLPRIFLYVSLRKKYSGEKKNEYKREEKTGS